MTLSINSDACMKPDALAYPSGTSVCDDKKRRRMESNRESARRSRQKKQQHLDGLIQQLGTLKRQNDEFANKINEFTALFSAMEAENGALNAQKNGLAAKLEGLQNVIDISSSSGNTTKPWKLPSFAWPITSSGFNLNVRL